MGNLEKKLISSFELGESIIFVYSGRSIKELRYFEKTKRLKIETRTKDIRTAIGKGKINIIFDENEKKWIERSNSGNTAYFCEAEQKWIEGYPFIEASSSVNGDRILWGNIYSCRQCRAYVGHDSGTYITGRGQEQKDSKEVKDVTSK